MNLQQKKNDIEKILSTSETDSDLQQNEQIGHDDTTTTISHNGNKKVDNDDNNDNNIQQQQQQQQQQQHQDKYNDQQHDYEQDVKIKDDDDVVSGLLSIENMPKHYLKNIEINDSFSKSGRYQQDAELNYKLTKYEIDDLNTKYPIDSVEGDFTIPKLFIGQIPRSVSQEDIKKKFEEFGDLTEAIVLRNPVTRVHKGCGFVKYETMDSAKKAIDALHTKMVEIGDQKCALQVKFAGEGKEYKLFVGMIRKDCLAKEVLEMFKPFGIVLEVHIITQFQKSKGCAFVKYRSKQGAETAIKELHDKRLPDNEPRKLIVRYAEARRNNGRPFMQKRSYHRPYHHQNNYYNSGPPRYNRGYDRGYSSYNSYDNHGYYGYDSTPYQDPRGMGYGGYPPQPYQSQYGGQYGRNDGYYQGETMGGYYGSEQTQQQQPPQQQQFQQSYPYPKTNMGDKQNPRYRPY